ncbi:MAG: 1-(5-phosphoribosyl)-5-[(5-phosphoribosylamino)methylideneamino]imidazole-4-carboxamide isomerase [Verrucomicrobiota bacterium]
MSDFTILPAIDLQGGQCVRLRQGVSDDSTVYSENPVDMAKFWEDEGARYLHVVDLDGAFQGHPVHQDVIGEIVKAISIPVEIGGGLRTDADIDLMLEKGVDRVILGTRALSDADELRHLIQHFGHRLAVGVDARDGWVQVKGWTETTDVNAVELAGELDRAGLKTLIYTDTARDGMLDGVNAPAMKAIANAVSCSVIASGGVSSVEDITRLKALDCANLTGAIVGKALYDKKVDLKSLQEA